jgi:hypothetical protein
MDKRVTSYGEGRLYVVPDVSILIALTKDQFGNILSFLPFKDVLRFRLVSKYSDLAVLYRVQVLRNEK